MFGSSVEPDLEDTITSVVFRSRTAPSETRDTTSCEYTSETMSLCERRESAASVPAPERPEDADRARIFEIESAHRLAVIDAQRRALLDARDTGTFDADVLAHELAVVDAAQIAIELRTGRV